MYSKSYPRIPCWRRSFFMLSRTSAWEQKSDSKLRRWRRKKVRKNTSKSGHQKCGTGSHYKQHASSCPRTVPWSITSSSPIRNTTSAKQACFPWLYNQSQKYNHKQSRNRPHHLEPKMCSRCFNHGLRVNSRSIMDRYTHRGVQPLKSMNYAPNHH